MEGLDKELLSRVQSLVAPRDVNGCMLWLGSATNKGFARITLKGRTYSVHKILCGYPFHVNLKSVCGNKLCVNPRHWSPVSQVPGAWREKTYSKIHRYKVSEDLAARSHKIPCHICQCVSRKNVIDHDHRTGVVRGILCSKHNVGLGLLGDTVENLYRAVYYLQQSGFVLHKPMPIAYRRDHVLGGHDRSLRQRTYANFTFKAHLFKKQGSACACCNVYLQSDIRKAHLDHEDLPCGSKKIRGVLCNKCNRALGMLGDNVSGVQRAIDYLEGRLTLGKD